MAFLYGVHNAISRQIAKTFLGSKSIKYTICEHNFRVASACSPPAA